MSSSLPPPPAVPDLPAGPRMPESNTSKLIGKLIQPAPTSGRKNSLFKLMNPELFVERTAKVSPSAWLVTGMVGFAICTIGYTQWDYTQTTKKTLEASTKAKDEAKQQRKMKIRQELEMEETRGGGRR